MKRTAATPDNTPLPSASAARRRPGLVLQVRGLKQLLDRENAPRLIDFDADMKLLAAVEQWLEVNR